LDQALAVVDHNAATVSGTLRATGNVDGHFTIDRRRRSYHLDGVLFYLAPRHLRFDLKSLGQRKILLGSNASDYWFCNAEDDSCQCGRHGASDDLAEEIPVPPLQIIEALGLSGVPAGATPDSQHIRREFQQVLFKSDPGDASVMEREYWLDRVEPRLIRRIIFRGADGRVRMESTLDDYRLLEPGGPWLPHTMTANWPGTGAHLRFRISKWGVFSDVGPDGPQFAVPPECGERRADAQPPR
jgi:hypothetical protein